MKTMIFLLMAAMAFMFSGCSTKSAVFEKAEPFLAEYGLKDDSTFLCADLFGQKVDCPTGLLQKDFGVPYTQGFLTMRVCFGFADSNTTTPDGMQCFVRNFIPDSNSTSTVYTELSPQSDQNVSD